MERLASGNAAYETPDAQISENKITVELEQGSFTEGEINIIGKNNEAIKGAVFSTDSHISFENNQINGINNVVKYTAHSQNLLPGQICSGTISIVTTAGDYAIPFSITVREKIIESVIGRIDNLDDFVNLVRKSYDDALCMFLSDEFCDDFLKDDTHAINLYKQVRRNSTPQIAMEEFLVGMNLKDRVVISLKEDFKECMNITENYGDAINVCRSTWGYIDIDVEVIGDFFYNCRDKITGDMFNGKIAEYQYYIDAEKLHGGSNCGKIIFRTANETVTYDIVVVNEKNDNDDYIRNKRSDVNLVKRYLDFRLGLVDGKKWMAETLDIAEQRLMRNKNDSTGLLAKAQISILQNQMEQAKTYLERASKVVAIKGVSDIIRYCYYLYVRSLYECNSEFTEKVKREVQKYFERGYDKWQLLWILFYIDDRYSENPSLKYTVIKKMFNNGCCSPIMYFEAASVLNQQPELLRMMNRFEIQVLNFAGKYHMVSLDLAKQASDIINRERDFNPNYIRILSRIYKDTECEDVLYSICGAIVNGKKVCHEYNHWLEEGVRRELKITNLYEHYIYTIDTSNYNPLEKGAYKYFSYGTETLMFNRDYFYANMIENIDEEDELYEKYKDGLEKYAAIQLKQGNNNLHMRKIYSRVIDDKFIDEELTERMPEILHTYRITVNNKNVRNVIVNHKEVTTIQSEPIVNNEAYVVLYTENPVIVFMDNNGRVLADLEYTLEPMTIDCNVVARGENLMTKLMYIEKIMKTPADYKGKIKELKEIVEEPKLTEEFRSQLREFIADYYFKGLDLGCDDNYLLEIKLDLLSQESRIKLIEVLIDRNLIEEVYPYLAKYGYTNIRKDMIQQVCLNLVAKTEYAGNALVTEMCGEIFRNGCRDEKVLKYLGKYYESGTPELYQIYLAIEEKGIQDNTMAENLLVQYIFEGNTNEKIYKIYESYLKGATATVIRKAFYTYVCYNCFIKKIQCPDIVWEILEQEYDNRLATSLVCKLAFIEEMSKRSNLTERQVKITERLITGLAEDNINFEFYKKFSKWFNIPYNLVDKTIIDFRTNPKHKVEITYVLTTSEGKKTPVTVEMETNYKGIFTKEFIMFYGEKIDYQIKEYSDEYPYGKVVDNSSIRISDKNAYNNESRFGMINGMLICKDLGKDEVAREMMQSYQLCKTAGREIFRLL